LSADWLSAGSLSRGCQLLVCRPRQLQVLGVGRGPGARPWSDRYL